MSLQSNLDVGKNSNYQSSEALEVKVFVSFINLFLNDENLNLTFIKWYRTFLIKMADFWIPRRESRELKREFC